MDGRGAAPKSKRRTANERAGLQFSVGRIHHNLKTGYYAPNIRILGSVYCAAVLEYLTSEVLEIAGNIAMKKKKRIIPRHILLSVRHDEELSQVMQDVTIPEGGVVPNIHPILLPKKQK